MSDTELVSCSFRIDAKLYEMIRQLADLEHRSVARQVALMLERGIAGQQTPPDTEHAYEAL